MAMLGTVVFIIVVVSIGFILFDPRDWGKWK